MAYEYTTLMPDGTEKVSIEEKKLDYKQLQAIVGGRLELIPQDYYSNKGWGNCVVFGYEEARLENQPRNEHFRVIKDLHGNDWDVVGVCVKEKRVHKKKEDSNNA